MVTPAAADPQAHVFAHRYVALDSLRGIAAFGVAVFHLQVRDGFANWSFFRASNQFVDFFFVLSGFVIAASYGERLAQGYPLRTFLWLRLGRIWPLHAVILVVYTAIECVLALTGTAHGGRVPFTGTRDPMAILPALLLIQAFTMPNRGTWNTQSWSISVELGLYLVFALAWRMTGRLTVAAGAIFALLLLATWEFRPEWIGDQVWTMRGFAGFGLGVGVRALERRLVAWGLVPSFAIASVLEGTALCAMVFDVNPATPLYASDLLFAAMVLVFAFGRGWFSGLLGTAPFVFLGTISYSLYMVHGFVIGRTMDVLTVVQRWSPTPLVERPEGTMGMLVTPRAVTDMISLAIIATAIGLAWVTWRWIEEPCRRWSRRMAESPLQAAVA